MPYEWSPPQPHTTTNSTKWSLEMWPYRSLLRREFVIFMGATAMLITLPLIAVLGTYILWGLLPFLAVAFCGLWFALSVSYKRSEVLETLTVTADNVHLSRVEPNGEVKEWASNRHWVTVHLHPTEGPVEQYITLRGNGREVELGAFLDPRERLELFDDIKRGLRI